MIVIRNNREPDNFVDGVGWGPLEKAKVFDTITDARRFTEEHDAHHYGFAFFTKICIYEDGKDTGYIDEYIPKGNFYLSGSRNLGVCKTNSDWDYVCDKSQIPILLEAGFEFICDEQYLDFNGYALYQKHNVQVVVCNDLEARLKVDELLRQFAPDACSILKEKSRKYVGQLYRVLYNAIGVKTDIDLDSLYLD